MATDFPTGIDDTTTLPTAADLADDNLDTKPHSTLHGDIGLAVIALETKVGIDGSADTDSLDYKVANPAGSVRNINQAAHGLAVSDVVRFDGTDYVTAQADSAANAEVVGLVAAVADADNFTLALGGRVTGLSALTAGQVYFLDPATAGALTATEPSAIGEVSKPLLIADSTTTGYLFNFRGEVITPAGGSTGDQHGFYSGNEVSVPDGDPSGTRMTWDSHDAGVELLDRSDPEQPAVLVDGIYAVTAVVQSSTALTPGGGLVVVLDLDVTNLDAVNEATLGTRADGRIIASLSCTFFIPAGGAIALRVINFDGSVDHDVKLREAVIQRVQ